jgi:hypothetical protein
MEESEVIQYVLGSIRSLDFIQPSEDEYRKDQQPDAKKCSPSREFTHGSCYTFEELKKMAETINKVNGKIIDIEGKGKKELHESVEDYFKNTCGTNEACWLTSRQGKQLSEKGDLKQVFKPPIPKKKHAWLSNYDIDDVMVQYEEKYPFFIYLGTAALDFESYIPEYKKLDICKLYKGGIRVIANVYNMDYHHQGGSHWVALFIDLRDNDDIKKWSDKIVIDKYYQKGGAKTKSIEFFDSVGSANDTDGKPPKEIDSFMRKVASEYHKGMGEALEYKFNTVQHQYKNSECGVYCINFILERLKGVPFKVVTGYAVKDDQMNERRKEFFRV